MAPRTSPLFLALLAACSTREPRTLDGRAGFTPYLGQRPPGATPELFAPGSVCTEAVELNGVFSPDGREFFFSRRLEGVLTILHAVAGPTGWSAPRLLPLYADGARALAVDMALSPDGTELYFLGQHAHEHAPESPGRDLWVSRRVDGAWTEARVVPSPVSTAADEVYPVVVGDGSLYFTSNRDEGRDVLYRAQRRSDGTFAEPVPVGPPIRSEAGIGDTFVTPDEHTMVFSSRRQPSQGRGDLFVSFRPAGGTWSEPIPLGPELNTAEHEFCPMLTPDGRYLFFSRRYGDTWATTTGGDVFWVAASALERLRPRG